MESEKREKIIVGQLWENIHEKNVRVKKILTNT